MRRVSNLVIGSVIVVVSTLFSIFLFEIILRILGTEAGWIKTMEANVLRDFKFEYNIKGLYRAVDDTVLYERDEFGLRDDCISPQNIEILTIGGSTTDQIYLKLSDTYQAVLGDLISRQIGGEICVSNAGIDGHSTYAVSYTHLTLPTKRIV